MRWLFIMALLLVSFGAATEREDLKLRVEALETVLEKTHEDH